MKGKRYRLNLMPLKLHLVERGMSAKVFAKKVGINPTSLYHYFSGKSVPTVRKLLQLCDYAGIEPGALFVEEKKKRK